MIDDHGNLHEVGRAEPSQRGASLLQWSRHRKKFQRKADKIKLVSNFYLKCCKFISLWDYFLNVHGSLLVPEEWLRCTATEHRPCFLRSRLKWPQVYPLRLAKSEQKFNKFHSKRWEYFNMLIKKTIF